MAERFLMPRLRPSTCCNQSVEVRAGTGSGQLKYGWPVRTMSMLKTNKKRRRRKSGNATVVLLMQALN
eukprot:5083972-Pleurochrysis_carterae.AAC.8